MVAIQDRPDDGGQLPDQPEQAEHLADAVRRRQAEEQEPIGHGDAAEPRRRGWRRR